MRIGRCRFVRRLAARAAGSIFSTRSAWSVPCEAGRLLVHISVISLLYQSAAAAVLRDRSEHLGNFPSFALLAHGQQCSSKRAAFLPAFAAFQRRTARQDQIPKTGLDPGYCPALPITRALLRTDNQGYQAAISELGRNIRSAKIRLVVSGYTANGVLCTGSNPPATLFAIDTMSSSAKVHKSNVSP